MVSSIFLGSTYTTNGKTVLSGAGGSGLDTQALVDALVQARSVKLTTLQDRVDVNTKKISALATLKTKLAAMKDASNLLRNVPGFGKAASNAFDYTTATVTTSGGADGSNYFSVIASPGTPAQSFTVNEISHIAKAKIQTTDTFAIANADTAVVSSAAVGNQFFDGSFTLTTATGSVDITLADGDTLNVVASKFNAVKATTGVAATVIKVADNNYKLQFSATSTGTDADFDIRPGMGNVVDTDGVFTNITAGVAQLQPADNAIFQINGEEITRQTNSISDVVTGLTFNIQQIMDDGTTLDVNVKPDTAAAKNAIIGYLNAYNDLRTFYAQQTKIDDSGQYAEDAVLATDSSVRGIISGLSNEVGRIIGGIGGSNYKSLADIGITKTDVDATETDPKIFNVFTIDEAKLDAALASNFDQVRSVFEFRMSSNSPSLNAFNRTNALSANSFTLNIDPLTSTYEATYTDSSGSHTINVTATAITGGYRLEGQKGTALEGLVLLYSSTASATIDVTATQGVADRLYNYLNDTVLNEVTGMLTSDSDSLKSRNSKLAEEITRQNDLIEQYRQQLLDKFGALESTIARMNSLLNSLDAQSRARDNAS